MTGVAQGVEWLKKAADGGSEDAMSSLAACYRDGVGVDKDKRVADEWQAKATAAGFVGDAGCDGSSLPDDESHNSDNATGIPRDKTGNGGSSKSARGERSKREGHEARSKGKEKEKEKNKNKNKKV
jgi:TPR repeat protein